VRSEDIYFQGSLAATVTEVGIALSPWVRALEQDDPTWLFLAAVSICAYDVVTGSLTGPFTENLAMAYARGAFYGAAGLDDGLARRLSDHFAGSMLRTG
jgi:hypothetical protein